MSKKEKSGNSTKIFVDQFQDQPVVYPGSTSCSSKINQSIMSSTRDSLDLKLQASRSPKNIAKNSSGGYRPAPGMAAQPAHSAMGMAAQLGHSAMGMTAQPSHPAPTLPRSHAHYQLPPTQVASPQLPVQVSI